MNAELLKDIQSKKGMIEGELDWTKAEIREINLKYKDTSRNLARENKAAMDPTGTKLHFKLSEIVMRPAISKKKLKTEQASDEDVKLFYSISDGANQFFNSVQESFASAQAYLLK